MKRKNCIAKACFFILVFLVSIISCEVGLGSAVDTEAPKLSIESPIVDSVIRDKFAIKGTWSDDGSIDSIVAELKRTDGYGTTIKLEGTNTVNETIEGKSGTWEVIVDYKEADLKDGTYQATVTIKDKGKHETSQNTTFTIDNTPPVLILTKPSSKPTDETLSVYGQRLFLEGSIADTTKETFIEVYFYKDEACTELLNTIKTQAIAPTDVNSNNGKLATFLDINYDKIYETEGLDKNDPARKHGAQPVYTKFKIYDSAIRIPVEEEKTKEDDEGNYTEYFYVSKDLSSKITLSKSSGGYGLAPIDLYNILNGSDSLKSNVRSATDIAAILTSLDSVKNSTSKFSINPDNSPYFTVSGLKTLTKSGSDFEEAANGYYVKNGTITLEVSVFMGSDSIELVDDDDFYVYLQECDDYGNPIESKPKIKLYSKYKEVQQQGQLKKTYYKIGGKEGHKTTTGAYVFSIPMNKTLKFDPDAGDAGIVSIDGLNYGSNYVLIVNGKDAEGNPVVPYDNGYGFKFSSSGNGPVLTVESPSFITTNTENLSADAIKTPLKVEFLIDTTESSLEIKRGEADLSDPSWDNAVAIQNENGVSQGPITNFTPPATVQAFDYYPVPSTVQDGQTYKLMYFVYDGVNEEPSTKKITYTVDNTPPVIGGITIEGSAYDTNKWYQKNTLALVVNVTDAGSKVYKVEYKTDELADWTALTKDGENFKGTITFLENGSRTLILRATDNVGNISSETSKIIKIDTGKPDLEGYFYKINGGDINELDSVVYVNPSKTITVYGKYGNKNSGVKELSASIKEKDDTEESVPTGWTVKYSTTEITKNTITDNLQTIADGAQEYSAISDKTSIKSWVATFTPKAGVFKIFGENNMEDANGLLAKTDKDLFEIIADTTPPTFENIDLSDSYKSKTEEKYYINNKKADGDNKVFKLSGVAKDDFGLSSVRLTIGANAFVQKNAAWSFENLTFNNADGENIACTLTAIDKAGNESEHTFTIVFDQSAPSAKHEIDGKEKDLYVRIGDDDNDDIEATETIDKKVGKKYSNGSYGNDVTIQLRGNFDDGQNGSGVSMIYYKVYASEAAIMNEIPGASEITKLTTANLDELKDKVIEKPTGKFTPLDEKNTKRVFYNVKVTKATDDKDSIVAAEEAKGGTWFSDPSWKITDPLKEGYLTQVGYYKFWKLIETSFNTTITGLSEGNNFVVFVVQDNVGNAKVDYAVIPKPTESNPNATETYPCYSLNVDTVVPNITTNHEDDILFTNLEGNVVLSGTVSDADAGIRSLEFFIGNTALKEKDGDITVYLSDTHNGNWTATIPAAKFSGSTTSTVYLLATDDAGKGNSTKSGVGTIKIDTAAPNVIVSSPIAKTTVNKEIIFSGTVSDTGAGMDDSVEKAPKLYWKTASTDWVELALSTEQNKTAVSAKEWDSTTGEWSFTIDTTKLSADGTSVVPNGTTAYFTVDATDKSGTGNVGYAPDHELTIDQNSDRPIITLSQIKKDTEVTLKTKTVYGSIKDDDGTLEKLWYWYAKPAPISDNLPSYNKANSTWTVPANWNEITIDGNSWSIDSPEFDGETTWYFAVADAKHTVFAAVGEDTINQPYLKYLDKTANLDGDSAGVKFKYDTNPPTPTYLGLYKAAKNTTTSAADIAEDESIVWSLESNIAFGKEYDILYAKVVVDEGTEMKALSGSNGSLPESSPISISYKNQAVNSPLTYEKILQVKGTGENEGKYTYYLGPITMDTTEFCEFKVTVEDAVGNKGYISRNIIVDNEAPVKIERVNPKASSEANGTFVYRGNVSDNDGGSGVEKIEWYIPKDTENDETSDDIEWKTATLSAGWEIDFSGINNLSTIIGYTVSGSTTSVSEDYDNYQTGSNTGVYQVPVWFRITDAVGNVGYNKENSIKYNPNTDRPSVQINNPEHNKIAIINGKTINYVIMGGGSARISGSADDNEGIEAVYLQFDLDGDGFWDNGVKDLTADLATRPTAANQMMSFCPWTYDKVEEILDDASKYGFGIKVGTTKNWSYTIDLSKDGFPSITETANGTAPNITYTYSGKTIKVRAISVDNDTENVQLTSAPSDVVNISVSNDIPLFNNLKLKQITGSNVKVEMDYVPGKYLTGNDWYITSDVYAYGGISSASYNGTVKNTNAESCFTAKSGSDYQFDMKIPIAPDENGKWDITITVTDNNSNPKQNMQQIQINIDNTAPVFEDQYSSSEQSVNGTVKHYLGGYGTKGKALTPSNPFADTDGLSSIWGKVTDNGSGFSKAVFYFKRFEADGTSNPRVYNPFGTKNENRTDLNSSKAEGKVYIDSSSTGDNLPSLYVKTVDGKMTVSRPSEFAIKVQLVDNTLTGVAGNTNIRKGGLIKIGGIYRTITSVENDGTINFDTSCDQSYTEAEIIYAMVVDTSGESSNNDVDSDGLIENISTVSSTTTWNAALPTSTIPDGPIQLHVVVFDEAGNAAHGYTKTAISNNPLRLTKVMLGTDLNRNGTYEIASEFEAYWAVTNTRDEHDLTKGKEIWDLDTKGTGSSYFIAKKGLAVIPEFVGGTGNIYYSFTKSTENRTEPQKQTSPSDSNMLKTLTTIVGEVSAEGTDNTVGQLVIDNNTIGSAGEDSMRVFSFSFWDSTESSTVGTNSSWTVLNAMIHQDLTDGTNPIAKINPFRWVDKTDNSIEWDSDGNALGHIELEDDWTAVDSVSNKLTGWDGKTDGTTYLDSDPKVSGKIKIEGTAFDETRLSSITVTFGNKTATATYSNNWEDGETDADFVLTVDDSGPTQNGHSVTWKLVVDTSKVVINNGTTNVAEKNIFASVSAKDASNNQNTASTTQTNKTTQTSYYRMDIVPYITGIDTALSKLKKNNPSVYARTALGHYAVASNEVLKIQGFNINGGVLKFKKTETTTVNSSYSEESAGYIIPSTAITGNVSITVNSIESLNNINNNDAYGTAYNIAPGVDAVGAVYKDKKFYNRQPNGDNNNLLTDDLVLDIWQITSKAAKPNSGPLSQPVMAINPKNKQVGFAFANGPLRFSMGSVEKSYDFWEYGLDFWTSIGFTYDANGNSFGTTAGGDIGGGGKSDCFGLFTSRWATKGFTSGTGGHNNGTGQLRLELIGQAESSNGTSFNGDNIDKQRIKSPSITTTVASSDATDTTVYLAYYDAINNEIRFKWGIISDANNTTGRSQNNLLYDYYGPSNSDGSDKPSMDTTTKTLSLTQSKLAGSLPYTLEYVSLIAGQTTGKYTFVPGASGTKYTANTAVMTNEEHPQAVNAGQYVSIAAKQGGGDTYERTIQKSVLDADGKATASEVTVSTADDLVVAVWYDAANNQMLYSYNTKPQNIKAPTYKGNNRYIDNGDGTSSGIDSFSQSATGWSTPVAVFGEGNGIGEYCKVVLDSFGKVHIACYDNANADVWYAYIDDFEHPENAKTCVVDSYGIVGTELSLDVAYVNSNPVPYISYYGSSCVRPKVAYWASTDSIVTASSIKGAEEEAFTKNWEVSIIPSGSKISIDHVNVGVWKDNSGNLTYSTLDGNVPNGIQAGKEGSNLGKANAGTTEGMVYGNGTKNPILGYAITQGAGGYIETAQMK